MSKKSITPLFVGGIGGLAIVGVIFTLAATTPTEAGNKVKVLSASNTISLNDEVSAMSVAQLAAKALELDRKLPKGKPIELVLFTPGGDIQAGNELIQNLKALGRPVNTITIFAASMGFQIAQNLSSRQVLQYGILMSHKARGEVGGEFSGAGTVSQLDSRLGLWKRRLDEMDKQTVLRTGGKQTLDSYRKAYTPELWLSGSESVEGGYADAVIQAKCDESLSGTSVKQLSFLGMRVDVTFSNCPLISGPLAVGVNVTTNRGTTMSLENFRLAGGQTGIVCLNNPSALCLVDPTITFESIERIKTETKFRYTVDGMKSRIPFSY